MTLSQLIAQLTKLHAKAGEDLPVYVEIEATRRLYRVRHAAARITESNAFEPIVVLSTG